MKFYITIHNAPNVRQDATSNDVHEEFIDLIVIINIPVYLPEIT